MRYAAAVGKRFLWSYEELSPIVGQRSSQKVRERAVKNGSRKTRS
jgi:hypothetical protein